MSKILAIAAVAALFLHWLAALVVWRTRAEQAMLAAWQARSVAIRAAGGVR